MAEIEDRVRAVLRTWLLRHTGYPGQIDADLEDGLKSLEAAGLAVVPVVPDAKMLTAVEDAILDAWGGHGAEITRSAAERNGRESIAACVLDDAVVAARAAHTAMLAAARTENAP